MAKQPNIILILCDQMRADCMGAAGHPDVKTPYLDSIAAEGTLFTSAYSACPSCIPARAALFTGQSQKRHRRVGYEDGVPWEYPQMLAGLMAQHGYHTEAIGKMHVHPPLRRCGFNNLRLHDGYLGYYRNPELPGYMQQEAHDSYLTFLKRQYGPSADSNDAGINCNAFTARPWVYDEMSHPTNWVVSESIDFLRMRDRDLPFMLMASFVRPHPPFDAPACYQNSYLNQTLRQPAQGNWQIADPQSAPFRFDSWLGTKDPTLQHQAMAGYYACITHLDHQIGRFMDTLEDSKVLEDSIIIFTSDHGEMLFDHGLFRKALPYQGSIGIPLLIRVGRNIADQPQVSFQHGVAELRDIAPTILQFANIPVPPSMDGKNLVPSLYSNKEEIRQYLHGEHTRGEHSHHFIVTETDKYIWYSQTGKEQYFHLQNDPQETRNLIAEKEHSPRIRQLQNFLVKELSSRPEKFVDDGTLVPGRPLVNLLPEPIYAD